ncbi:M20 family metallopeptidase [Enterovirga rhinocerotis]|nr:M20 family metallopeptidase [Enterovirga rhinocerotis]
MVKLLEEVVNLDSGSYDKEGVDRVGERFERFFTEHGIPVVRRPRETFGDAFLATIAGSGGGNRPIVLMGHRDTVFPKGEAGRRPFSVKGNRAYGPGVADMKAGLVMNAFVAAAFHKHGGAPAPLTVLITSDEEIGSPACRPIIEETARGARCVFNAEPGRPTGNVVTGRKGGVFMECTVTGKASHSGGNFQAGISAINEVAHKIVKLKDVTDLERGTTLNVGLVSGGQSVNTVAPWAKIGIDLRYVEPPHRAEAMAKIEAIVAEATVEGTSAVLEIKGEFLPLVQDEASKEILGLYQEAMSSLGHKVEGEFSGGCADSGFTSAVGCPTVCSTGPVGGLAHSPDEYLELDSILPRAKGVAMAIAALR